MINIFLFLAAIFILTFLLGKGLEKIRVPWIFAALLIGFLMAIVKPFIPFLSFPDTFNFLAELGMYFLLFVIGFEIDLNKLKKIKKFVFKATFFIILFEAFFGTMLIHYVFGYEWIISFIVALSFATVGEAVLIPILDEFKIVNTKLGQSIISIGILDDMIEIFALILASFLIGSSLHGNVDISIILLSLLVLFLLSFGLTKLRKKGKKFTFINIEILFVFVLFILFLFLGVAEYAHATPVAALLAGIALKTYIPEKRLKTIESEVKTMCYGFFAPLFFFWVGTSLDISYLISYPLLILLVVAVSKGAKILSSYIVGKNELGTKKSILLGIGLSVRFSTSIIIIKLLFDGGLIGIGLYSVIIASSIVFKFIIPLLFSNLLVRWKVAKR